MTEQLSALFKRRCRDAWPSPSTRHLFTVTAPAVVWITFCLVLPGLYIAGLAFMTNGPYGAPQWPLTLDAFKRLAGFGVLGWSPGHLYTLLRSLQQAVIATLMVIVVAYPTAYYISTRPAHWRPVLLLLIVLPSWTNQVIRAVGWMNILAPGTPISTLAAQLGLTTPELGLFPSALAVIIGLVYNFLPFMVLPLYAAFERLDQSRIDAARDLYAGPLRGFWHAVLPQTLPGLAAGVVLVSIPAFGMYVVPELLGGGRSMMIGTLVARQFTAAANWPLGGAGALLMIVIALAGLVVLRRMTRRLGRDVML